MSSQLKVRVIAELGHGSYGRVYLIGILDDAGNTVGFSAMKQTFRWGGELVTHDMVREINMAQLLANNKNDRLLTADNIYLGKTYSIMMMEPLEGTMSDIFTALCDYIPKHKDDDAGDDDVEAEEVDDADAEEEDDRKGSDDNISDAESLGDDDSEDSDEEGEENEDEEITTSDPVTEVSEAVTAAAEPQDMEIDFSYESEVIEQPSAPLVYQDGVVIGSADCDDETPVCFRSGDMLVITYETVAPETLHKLINLEVVSNDLEHAKELLDQWDKREVATLHDSLERVYKISDPRKLQEFIISMITELLECQRNINQLGFLFDDLRGSNVGFRIMEDGTITLTYIDLGNIKRLSMPYDITSGMLDPESLPREFFERDAIVAQTVDVWQIGVLAGRLFYPHESFFPTKEEVATEDAAGEEVGWGGLGESYLDWFKDRLELRGLVMFIDEKGANVDDYVENPKKRNEDKLWYEVNLTPTTLDAITQHVTSRRSYADKLPYWFVRWYLQMFMTNPTERPSAAALLKQLRDPEIKRCRQLKKKVTPKSLGLLADPLPPTGSYVPTEYRYHMPRAWKQIPDAAVTQKVPPQTLLSQNERISIIDFMIQVCLFEDDVHVWNMPLLLQSLELYAVVRNELPSISVDRLFPAAFLLVDRTFYMHDRFIEHNIYDKHIDQELLHRVIIALHGLCDPDHTIHRSLLAVAQSVLSQVQDIQTNNDNTFYNTYGYLMTAYEHLVELLHWNALRQILAGDSAVGVDRAVEIAKYMATLGHVDWNSVHGDDALFNMVRDPQDRHVYRLYNFEQSKN